MLALEQLEKDSYFGLIYKITNKINGKIYIGQTKVTLKKRISGHLAKCNAHLKSAFVKYGIDNFEFIIICYVFYQSQQLLDSSEQIFIRYYKSDNNKFGYNKTSGGKNNYIPNKEFKKHIKKLKNKLPKGKFSKERLKKHRELINSEPIKKKHSMGLKRYYENLSPYKRNKLKKINRQKIAKGRLTAYIAISEKYKLIRKDNLKTLNSIDIKAIIQIRVNTKNLWHCWKEVKITFKIQVTFPNFKLFMINNNIHKKELIK